ncbi:uncharacterized protein DS421_18g625400 [Arachis hypogaea]|nr:uncharacterized protein DS421_18g625400 [Arachis hypogaea]
MYTTQKREEREQRNDRLKAKEKKRRKGENGVGKGRIVGRRYCCCSRERSQRGREKRVHRGEKGKMEENIELEGERKWVLTGVREEEGPSTAAMVAGELHVVVVVRCRRRKPLKITENCYLSPILSHCSQALLPLLVGATTARSA